MTPTDEDLVYAQNAPLYWEAGWRGVIPLDPGTKDPPPEGWTGRAGRYPSRADLQTFMDESPRGNIALRLPTEVVGIDVDAHSYKPGAETLRELEDRLGLLPPTLRSTSRDDGVSGIRLFRAPEHPSWRNPGPGIEIIHAGWRYVVAAPSTNPHNDGLPYFWIEEATGRRLSGFPRPEDLPDLPPAWVEFLSSERQPPQKAEVDDEELRAWLTGLRAGPACDYVLRIVDELRDELRVGSRHDAMVKHTLRLVRAGDQGHRGVSDAVTNSREAFLAAATRAGEGRRGSGEAEAEWERALGGALAIVMANPDHRAQKACSCSPVREKVAPAAAADVRSLLDKAVSAVGEYMHLPDPIPLWAVCAAAATVDFDGEPVWLMLIAAPSSGKTELLKLLSDLADEQIGQVTTAGLLSWNSKGKKAVGVLTRVGARILLTVLDFSAMLADSDRGRRDAEYAILRDLYDGRVSRGLGNVETPLVWEGRATMLAAATPEVDRYSSHSNALGPRWINLRMYAPSAAEQRQATRLARRHGAAEREELRSRARQEVTQLLPVARAGHNQVDLGEQIEDAIEECALACAAGRASVPRHSHGAREIVDAPTREEPHRLIRQLQCLARGALAIGLTENETIALCRRVALDSMPRSRSGVLRALSTHENCSTSALAKQAGLHRDVVKRQLEELEAIGVVTYRRAGGPGGEVDRRTILWQLVGADGENMRRVLDGGCHEVLTNTTPPPKKKRRRVIRKPHPTGRGTSPVSTPSGRAMT